MLCSTAKTYDWPGSISAGFLVAATLVLAGCGSSTSVASTQTATPVFSPGATISSTPLTVKISDATFGAVLYCTTDGTAPTTSSPLCSQPTTISQTEFLQAIAVAPGMATSAVMSAGYTISLNAEDTPVFTPAGGNYSSAQTVTIANSSGANIFYCVTAGCTPTTASTAYSGPITVPASETVNAIAAASGYANSSVASATYAIVPPLAAPTFSLGSTTLRVATPVTISAASGATIYYTTDGTAPPSSTSTVVAGNPVTVTVSQPETINAVAELGTQTSAMESAAYAFVGTGAVPSPTFSPGDGGTVRAAQDTITLGDTDSKATIYYTYDGSSPFTYNPTYGTYSPSATAQPYTVPFRLPLTYATTGSALVQAFALDAGTGSQLSSSYYIVKPSAYAQPVFTPSSGSIVVASQTVTIAEADASAPVYYNIDSSTAPTSSSSLYTPGTPIQLPGTGVHTIQAIAIDPYNPVPVVVSSTYFVGTAGSTIYGAVSSAGTAITGAKVQLYAAGYTGYGSAPVALGSAVTTDGSGLFHIGGYTCPPQPLDQVYLMATGGTEGSNSSNKSIALMTALGSCGSLPAAVTTSGTGAIVNEVTTIASAYALSAFSKLDTTNGGIDVGAPETGANCNAAGGWQTTPTAKETCNYIGLQNAFNTVNNLVNVTGAAQSYTYSLAGCVATTGYPSITALYPYTCTAGSYSDVAGAARSITPGYSSGNYAEFPYNGTTTGTITVSPSVTAYGTAGNSTLAPFQPYLPYYNTSTVPQARINALANVLASCVEGGTTQCGALFLNAKPTGGTAPADTLQTALNIALNPGSNGISPSTLLGLMASAYTPSLSVATAPGDLTLALTFTGGGLGIHPSTYPGGFGADARQVANQALAIDKSGNIWVGSSYMIGGSTTIPSGVQFGTLALFSNQGAPLTTEASIVPGTTVANTRAYGGFRSSQTGSTSLTNIAFDQSGTLWGEQGSSLLPFSLTTCGGSPCLSLGAAATPSNTSNLAINGIFTIDASGNLWGTDPVATFSYLQEYEPANGELGFNGFLHSLPIYINNIIFDSNGGLWASGTNETTGESAWPDIEWLSTLTPGTVDYNPFATSGYYATPYYPNLTSLVADNAGNVYGCIETNSQFTSQPLNQFLSVFSESNGGAYSTPSTGTSTGALPNNGRGCGDALLMDGMGRLFAVSNDLFTGQTNGATRAAIDEFAIANGSVQQLSPSAGYSGNNGSNEPVTLNPSYNEILSQSLSSLPSRDSAIDSSGNLWVINPTTGLGPGDKATTTVLTPGPALVEYVGLAAPVVTPTSVALRNGLLAQRP